MGQQVNCTARFGRKSSAGTALLESEELIFRGDFRLAIRFRAMKSVRAVNGELQIEFPDGVASFALGSQAEKWAKKILHPKSLIDKLGVKPGALVSVLGVSDASFSRQLTERTVKIADGKPCKDCDFIFLATEARKDLLRLKSLMRALKTTGAVWVVYPKGQAHITETDVLAAGKQAGLVDVKVVAFSPTHTALKFVIPISRR